MKKDEYAVCSKCHDIIIRRGASHHWKLVFNKGKEPHEHKILKYIFTYYFEIKKIRLATIKKYWTLPDEEHADYGKAFEKCFLIVLKELNYVSS